MKFVRLFLLLIVLILAFFIYFDKLNPVELTLYYLPGKSLTFSASIVLIACLALGLMIGYGAHLYASITHWMKHWQTGRHEKKSREVGVIYRDGVNRLLSGDLKKAHTLLQKALDRDPKRIDTYIAMANVNLQEGDSKAALSLLLKARELDPKSLEVLFKLANTYEETGAIEDARANYQFILDIEANNRKAIRSLRDLAMKNADWPEALDLQKRVLKVAAGSKRIEDEQQKMQHIRYEVARLKMEDGQADKAISELQEILKENAKFTPARVTLGDAYQLMNRAADAVKVWQDGYRDLGRSVFLSRLEDHYMDAEDPATLLAFYRARLAENQNDMVLRLFFGKFCLRLEMVDEAVDQLFTVESSGVESSQLHFLLAEAYRRRERKDDAIDEYKRALGADKHLRLGYVCDSCATSSQEWQSRCPACQTWGTLSLLNRQLFREARPLEAREIHHGEH
jgi:lipopolysaccharide biosynthesis regulator YciM